MKIHEYQDLSLRTLNWELDTEQQLTNMILGIIGETGEVADILKKALYQGHELDIDHVAEEIGDVMFYIANLCTTLNLKLETIVEDNVAKLEKRYPNGFEIEKSLNRDE